MEEYLKQILNYERDNILWNGLKEDIGQAAIIKHIVKYKNYKVVLYGAGSKGYHCLEWLRKKGVNPLYVIDANHELWGMDFYGIEIIKPSDIKHKIKNHKILAVIGTSYFLDSEERNAIIKSLLSNGVAEFINPYESEIMGGNYPPNVSNWQHYFLQNQTKLFSFMKELKDDESKKVLCEYIRAIFFDDIYRLPELPTEEKYFGDGLYENIATEKFINCGSSIGDTIMYFIDKYNDFSKIYAFEGDKLTMKKLERNLNMLPSKIKDKIQTYECFLGSQNTDKSLDKLFTREKISLINMDIEGAELDVLRGTEIIIRQQEPILSICVYHKKEDLIEITDFINKCSNNYNIYLRKYASSNISVSSSRSELVLYAIPNYRLIANS